MFGNEEQPNCNWKPCEAGGIVRIASRLKRRRLLRQIASGGLQALLLAVPVSFLAWRSWRGTDRFYGGIGCREMLSLLLDYEQDGLPSQKRTQVRDHLAQCGNCWLMQQFRKSQDEDTAI